MNRWRVGEDRGSKETDGCPLTVGPAWKGASRCPSRFVRTFQIQRIVPPVGHLYP
jgi:hypothetical protein